MEPEVTTPQRRSFTEWLGSMPRWKQILLGASALGAVIGGVMMLVQGSPTPTGGSAGAHGELANGLVSTGSGTGGTGAATQPAGEPAAKGVFRLGSSFLIGFCIGSFVRAAVKTTAVAVGFFLVALFLLERSGFVVVDWTAIDGAWGDFWSRVGEEWGDFQRFFTGRLPAAGLATLGLYAGIKRH